MNLQDVIANRRQLVDAGDFERALIDAYMNEEESDRPPVDADEFASLVDECDYLRLRKCGEWPPPEWPFPLAVFRGVSGANAEQYARGWSWTTSLSRACFFATRNGIIAPVVYVAEVPAVADVRCFLNIITEREVLWRPGVGEFHRVDMSTDDIIRRAASINDFRD